MIKYGNKDLRKRWKGNVNINTIHLGTTNIWPYITNVNYGDWKVNVSTNTIPASGGTITVTSVTRNIVYTWVNFVGTTNTRYTTTETETITDFTLSSSVGSVNGHTITVPYNPNTSDRNVVITVTLPTGGQVQTTVVQAKNVVTYSAWNLTLSVSPTSIPSSGGTATITSSCTRTYTNSNGQPGGTETSAVNLSTNVGSISGNTLTVPANSDTSTKTITVTATARDLTKTTNLSQEGATIIDTYVLKTSITSISGEQTSIRNGNIWFEHETNGTKVPVDTLTVDTGEIYSFEGDILTGPNPTQTKFVWHGLANVSNTSKTITLTATNTSKNLSGRVTIEHLIPSTRINPTNWYLHITNIHGENINNLRDNLLLRTYAMKQGIVPQQGTLELRELSFSWSGSNYEHDTSIIYSLGEMGSVNASSNSLNLVNISDGSIVEFYKRNGSKAGSTTYTKIGQMVVDSTKSKTLDCITGKVYPDDFV